MCLKNFKFKTQVRLFSKTFEEIEAEKKEREENKASKQPLLKLNFSLHGKLERKNDDIKAIIMRLGGKVSMSLCLTTVALISSEGMLIYLELNLKIFKLKAILIQRKWRK